MEEYRKIYDNYIQKSDEELREVINPKNGYSRTDIEVAWDILCYERKIDDLGYDSLDDLLKHCDINSREIKGKLRKIKETKAKGYSSNDSKAIEIFQKLGVLLLLVVIYPLGLIFLWKNKKFDKAFKIVESICCFVLWILLIGVAVRKLDNVTGVESRNTVERMEELDYKEEISQIETEASVPKDIIESEIVQTEAKTESVQEESETLMPESIETFTEETVATSVEEREISKLLFDGTNIIDVTIADMKQYEYITDIAIKVDEKNKDIKITVQVPSSIDIDIAKMVGEDVARYLAFCASAANSYYSSPGITDLGGIYKKYDLLLYVDDGIETFNMYGAKVKTVDSITWR